MQIINFKKKKLKLLTNEQQKVLYIVKKNMDINMLKVKIIVKFGTIAMIQEKIQVLHIAYVI